MNEDSIRSCRIGIPTLLCRAMTESVSRSPDRRQILFFSWFSLAVVAIWTVLLRGSFYGEHPSLAAAGVAIDLAITLPLVWYLVAVRRAKASPTSLIPMVISGLIAAHVMTPGDPPPVLLALVGVAELAIATMVVIRVRRAIRSSGGAADPLERIEGFASEIVPVPRAAKMMASEIGIFWYALFSWKKAPPKGEGVMRWAKVEDWTGVMIGFLVVIIAETIGLHLWLMTKWPNAVWLLTLSDLYAIVWLIADARALSLSAVRRTDSALEIRFGIRWRAEVPLEEIESMERIESEETEVDLKLALVEEPDTIVTFRRPITFEGPYGFTKQVKTIGLLVEGLS